MGPDQNETFSEYGHVAYQIKADDACSNRVANILPTDTFSTQGVGSKGQTISFSESSHVRRWQQHDSIYFANRHTLDPEGGVKRSNYLFF